MNGTETTQRMQEMAQYRQTGRRGVFAITLMAVLGASMPISATVLKLDENGNYVDAQASASGPTPYAAPDASVDVPSTEMTGETALEEGLPFPDPNAEVATDARRMENPASQYEIILNEVNALAEGTDAPRENDMTDPSLEIVDDGDAPDSEPDIAQDFPPAEPGGLVFAAIVPPEAEIATPLEPVEDAPIVLRAMRSLEPAATEPVEDLAILDGTDEYDAIIFAEVAKYDNIDFPFVKAVIAAESNFNTIAVSPKGAMGLMQIMPATAETYDVINPFSPEENIRAGTAELSRLMTLYNNPTLALAAYNAGEGAVAKHNGVPPFRETQEYIVRVLTKTFAAREVLAARQTEQNSELEQKKADEDTRSRPLFVQTFDW